LLTAVKLWQNPPGCAGLGRRCLAAATASCKGRDPHRGGPRCRSDAAARCSGQAAHPAGQKVTSAAMRGPYGSMSAAMRPMQALRCKPCRAFNHGRWTQADTAVLATDRCSVLSHAASAGGWPDVRISASHVPQKQAQILRCSTSLSARWCRQAAVYEFKPCALAA
jgi:hypothetical protein